MRLAAAEAADLLRRALRLPRVYLPLVGRKQDGLALGLFSDSDYHLFMSSLPQSMLGGWRNVAVASVALQVRPLPLQPARLAAPRCRTLTSDRPLNAFLLSQLAAYHPIDFITSTAPACPVLLVVGSADTLTPPSVVRAGKARLGPRARYVEVPGATHVSLYETPGLAEDIIVPFLREALSGRQDFD